MNIKEAKLIKQSQQGDMKSFEKLVRLHQDQAYRTAFAMLGNTEDAKDATQEAFIKIYKSLNKFKHQSSFSTWMYRIVHNTCLDILRRRKRRREVPVETKNSAGTEGYEIPLEDTGDGPESLLDYEFLKEEVKKGIGELPEEYQGVIILRDIEGLSYSKVAEVMEISQGTVKSRLNRGRKMLRNYLNDLLQND